MKVTATRDGHLKKVLVQVSNVNKKKLRVGIFPESGDLEMIARVHEFGCTIRVTPKMRKYLHGKGLHLRGSTDTITIPERSFIRAGYRQNKRKFVNHSKDMLVRALQNRASIEPVIGRLGNELAGDIQDFAVDLKNPANHPFTIAQKKSSNPLVDTGRMISEIISKVE